DRSAAVVAALTLLDLPLAAAAVVVAVLTRAGPEPRHDDEDHDRHDRERDEDRAEQLARGDALAVHAHSPPPRKWPAEVSQVRARSTKTLVPRSGSSRPSPCHQRITAILNAKTATSSAPVTWCTRPWSSNPKWARQVSATM